MTVLSPIFRSRSSSPSDTLRRKGPGKPGPFRRVRPAKLLCERREGGFLPRETCVKSSRERAAPLEIRDDLGSL